MPAIIYFITVILYLFARRKLTTTGERGFKLGAWEWPVIIVSLVWLVFELSIFRDASFKDPWIYVAIMMGIGLDLLHLPAGRTALVCHARQGYRARRRGDHGALRTTASIRTALPGLGGECGAVAPQAPEKGHRAALPGRTRIPITKRWSAWQESTSWPTTPAPAATRRC